MKFLARTGAQIKMRPTAVKYLRRGSFYHSLHERLSFITIRSRSLRQVARRNLNELASPLLQTLLDTRDISYFAA
jgi:hypothetical protein